MITHLSREDVVLGRALCEFLRVHGRKANEEHPFAENLTNGLVRGTLVVSIKSLVLLKLNKSLVPKRMQKHFILCGCGPTPGVRAGPVPDKARLGPGVSRSH